MPFLTDLLANYHGAVSLGSDAEGLAVTSITADSQQAVKGSLFVAVKGARSDGSAHASDAVARGAVAVVTDNEDPLVTPEPAVRVRVDNARQALARMAAAFYAPQPDCIAAVTGTDGKTSTADFFRQLWQMSGQKAASIGTLGILRSEGQAGDGALNTTPDPVSLHRDLQALAKEGYAKVALEASSHGLHQHRLDGARIVAAAFTNLTRDHLDYHGTEERYFEAKLRLFSDLLEPKGVAVLNADDPRTTRIAEICAVRGIHVIRYGYHGPHYRIRKITPALEGLALQIEIMGTPRHFMLQMPGAFQAMNALAALGLYVACGGEAEEGMKHLPHLSSVPGRLQKVASHPNGAPVFIDYAHTPAALANVLATLRPHVKNRLAVVFGCGGDRDSGKRPEMGKAAAKFADRVIITDDNPRSENPAAIRAAVQAGAPDARNIGDRAQAINEAVRSLASGDVLLIAGKGHEKTQTIGDAVLPFDDAQVARAAIDLCGEGVT